MYWEVRLEPYDLVAVQLSEPNVQFSNPQAAWPDTVETALGSQIRRLGARAAALRNPPPLDVLANPGFERPAAGDGPIPDWAVSHAQRRQHPIGQDAETRRPANRSELPAPARWPAW